MKSIIFTLLLVATSLVALAQCTPLSSTVNSGLSYANNEVPCFEKDSFGSYTVYFKNFGDNVEAVGTTVNIDSIIVDSVGGLPCGVTWTTNKAAQGHKFVREELGCFQVSGTPTDGEGVYEGVLYIIAYVNNQPNPLPRQPSTLFQNTRIVVKVVLDGASCATETDTVLSTCSTPFTGINSVTSNVSAFGNNPNPFSSFTNIQFTAQNSAVYTLKVVNMLGAVVYTEQVAAEPGNNIIRMERNNLPAGVYVYSISNGTHSINNRMVVAQ